MANPQFDVKKDRFAGVVDPHGIGKFAAAIVPNDTAAVAIAPGGTYAKRLYIGVAGDVTVIMAGDASNGGFGTPVLFKAHPVGYMDAQVRAVMATGTTATNIVGIAD
jgi:hypothetical protein